MRRFSRSKNCNRFLETLESRLLCSVTIVNPTTATYTDFDGDAVTVKTSLGGFRRQ